MQPMDVEPVHCPLCGTDGAGPFHRDERREFLRCKTCQLVFVPARFHLSLVDERAEYDLHENSPGDTGYRRFLNRLLEPLVSHLEPTSTGLDFGCGPGPTLSVMFEESGHSVALFDPFYAADESTLQRQYDFVTASEVVEHFREPRRFLDQMWCCVRPGGWLGIMTKRVLDDSAFATWHYKDDLTHVSFFSEATFGWLADVWSAELNIIGPDVVLLRKTALTNSAS